MGCVAACGRYRSGLEITSEQHCDESHLRIFGGGQPSDQVTDVGRAGAGRTIHVIGHIEGKTPRCGSARGGVTITGRRGQHLLCQPVPDQPLSILTARGCWAAVRILLCLSSGLADRFRGLENAIYRTSDVTLHTPDRLLLRLPLTKPFRHIFLGPLMVR